MTVPGNWTRRELLQAAVALGLTPAALAAGREDDTMLMRPVPASDESLPVIGLGTYDVFDVDPAGPEIPARREILETLFARGGRVIDTSPMYARSEAAIGVSLRGAAGADHAFLATKVWTDGRDAGIRQMETSARLLGADVIDLMQVHNLRDIDTHYPTLLDWQQDGRIRYHGITHYRASALDDLAAAMRRYRPQFIQINYSVAEREAATDVLPLAADMGIAVIVNRPFAAGQLFPRVRGRELPGWAEEFCASWGQFFLKYIISHPAVTCAIPATSKPHHMLDNAGAGFGPLPDDATRARMVQFVASL